jgi:hypothetical protein
MSQTTYGGIDECPRRQCVISGLLPGLRRRIPKPRKVHMGVMTKKSAVDTGAHCAAAGHGIEPAADDAALAGTSAAN